jgi:4-hydroxy 2-oxovalerate aldolase
VNKLSLPTFKILDCTIRDGGYVNNWGFDKKLVREVYRALSKSGVEYVEIGFRGTEKHFDRNKYGLWRFTPEEHIREATDNIVGAKLALMADYGKVESGDFCVAKESVVDLVRIAVHKNNLKGAISLLEQIKEKGYDVSLNVMGYANYSENERKGLVGLLKSAELDYVCIADSYGSLFPDQIMPLFEPLLNIPDIKVGFHPHNSLQMAFANSLEAIRCGVHIIDSTIYGMGRAAGNLPTEIIVSFLEKHGSDRYNSIPVLNVIDSYFVSMHSGNKWGYQLPYMLSGMFQCHPDYAKSLIDHKEFTIEDIWKALNYIKQEETVGFSRPHLDELINQGMIGGLSRITDEESLTSDSAEATYKKVVGCPDVPYVKRYEDRDFLVIANGPSIKDNAVKIENFISRYDPVILGGNYLGGLFKPDYHCFVNKRRFVSYIDTVDSESKLLLGQYIPDEMIQEYTDRDYEKIYYIDVLNSEFQIKDGVITTNCRTVSVLLMGVAIAMGARRIFCVGMDGYIGQAKDGFHFYSEKDEQEDKEMILERHLWNQKFIEQIDAYLNDKGKEGIHILTPTSYKSFYKSIENYI